MSSICSLLDLPDLVLYNICSYITCPFDLLRFGNSCQRLRNVASAPSLWWAIAFRWFRGVWIFMEEGSTEDNSREWVLDIIQKYSTKVSKTEVECEFLHGEIWQRVNSPRLHFLYNLLTLAYANEKDEHPAVLYEQWLYDIGVYRRIGSCIDYTDTHFILTRDMIHQLSSLSQAAERDLGRRKQPHKDFKYYIKKFLFSEKNWTTDLFPRGYHGSVCPLLMCPFQFAVSKEVSGLEGMAMCLSVVLESRLKNHCISFTLPLHRVWEVVKMFCTIFVSEISHLLPSIGVREDRPSLRSQVLTILEGNSYDYKRLQSVLDYAELNFSAADVMADMVIFLKGIVGIDFAVDEVRMYFRKAIMYEIEKYLFPPESSVKAVTRVNLTDCDLIGGDNAKQEMSSAAFISDYGVLVSWHLIGRVHY